MKQFKVICKVGNQDDYSLFIKANDKIEAEKEAKYYFILDHPELDFYSVNQVVEV